MHFRMHFRFLSAPHLTQRFLGHQKKRCVNIKKLVKPLLNYTWQKLKHLIDENSHSTPPVVRYDIYIPSTKEVRSGGTVD